MNTIATCLGISIIFIIVLEHLARINNSNKKPSVLIRWIADKSISFWKWLGRKFAWVSSFLEYLKLSELGLTILDILKPTYEFLISPFYSIKEYYNNVMSYKHPWIIICGSIVLVISTIQLTRYVDLTKYIKSETFH